MAREDGSIKYDEIEIGKSFETARYDMSLDRIREFASTYDPQQMHLDEVKATSGPFGKLVASGWHTLCVTMKLMVEASPFGATPLVGAGVDNISFRHPVCPGDVLFIRATDRLQEKVDQVGAGIRGIELGNEARV